MNFIYQKITDQIIKKLEQGTCPWQKKWNTVYPKNLVSQKAYKGINVLLLGMNDFESEYYLSYKQVKDLGGNVKKDSRSQMVVFWKPILNYKIDDLDETNVDIHFLLRYYNVFNLDQVEVPDIVLEKYKVNTNSSKEKIIKADEIINNFPNPPEIKHNNLVASPRYYPKLDKIELPAISNFHSSEDYYASLFHEMIHSTGHQSRCKRKNIMEKNHFGDEAYSTEELVAEIGASFLCNLAGISKTFENQASYISSWLNVLRNDVRMITIAASQAQKACDYILNNNSTNINSVEAK